MNLLILVPRIDSSGPIKGALALANLLSENYKITIISIKNKVPKNNKKYPNIEFISLYKINNFFVKIIQLRKLIKKRNSKCLLLSICFSADFLSLFVYDLIPRITSIRSNLFINYFYTYKFFGFALALFHLISLRFFNYVIVMNSSMKKQIKFFSKKISIIPNFINENELSNYFEPKIDKTKPIKFVFVGSLIERKNPLLLINAYSKIVNEIKSTLHIVGDGPLLKRLKKQVKLKDLRNKVFFHGFQKNPYKIMKNCDLLVIPSFSEGTSRAMLESLYLGVPCIAKNVDSNSDLISNNMNNGSLFNTDKELSNLMKNQALKSRRRKKRINLLPLKYRKNFVKKEYLEFINNNFH